MIRTDLGLNTEAMAMGLRPGGITRALASTIADKFATCTECGEQLTTAVGGSKAEDRDVIWANRVQSSSAVECGNCRTENRILVEEKAFGVISADRLPDEADKIEDLVYIPVGCEEYDDEKSAVEQADQFLRINLFQIMTSEAAEETGCRI
jgi:hypothetical protein